MLVSLNETVGTAEGLAGRLQARPASERADVASTYGRGRSNQPCRQPERQHCRVVIAPEWAVKRDKPATFSCDGFER